MEGRILIVEDSNTQALALQSILEDAGFEVERAASGEHALECLERSNFDLILSDVVMPGMSGYDLCRRVRNDARFGSVPIMLLTSLADPLDIVRGLECGADNYVTKPYDPEYLLARTRNVLDRRRMRHTSKATLGVNVSFLGTTFSINSEKEQILDLFISSIEDVVRTNAALQESQRRLADAQEQLAAYASTLAHKARVSEERYAMLMHEASDAIVVLDRSGRILEANVRATELFGRTMEQLRNQMLVQNASATSTEALKERLDMLEVSHSVYVADVEFVRPDGGSSYCNVSASRTASGSDELILAIIHDVTHLRVTAERLRRSEAQLRQAQRFAQLGSWERNVATGSAQWSDEVYRILGLDPAKTPLTRENFLQLVDPAEQDRVRRAFVETESTGAPFNEEFRVVRTNGAPRVVHARAELMRDEGGAEILRGTIQDVTERKQLEQQFYQSQKIEAVGQLAGGVAHDFNNLLTVITSYCGIALSELPPDAPMREEFEQINSAADRAAVLTRQLLAFSRRQVLQSQNVDLNQLVENLKKLLQRLIRENIEFVTRLEPGVGIVFADPGQLEQVMVNLVVNACDAMPEGGTLTLQTSHATRELPREDGRRERHDCVVLKVTDTGTGMSEEVLTRIFEPFFTTKPVGQGTGLGLSTVYGIVQQSGGEVVVESDVGSGTTFSLYLPCAEREVSSSADATPATSPRTAQGETILVVEDDAALRTVAVRILRRQGYNVLEARNGVDALQVCDDSKRIDLVLTDVVMPQMSGYELGQRIAAKHPRTKVLYMSGYSSDVARREQMVHNHADYIDKPFTVPALIARLQEVLSRS